MSHRMYLAVWVVLYGSDVEEAETTMPILAFLTVLQHLDVSMLWLRGERSRMGRSRMAEAERLGKKWACVRPRKSSYFNRQSHETSNV